MWPAISEKGKRKEKREKTVRKIVERITESTHFKSGRTGIDAIHIPPGLQRPVLGVE
jgi:hypothetical protein